MWVDIKSRIMEIQEKNVPSKLSTTRFSQAWTTREVKSVTRRKKRSYKKARETGKLKDWERYQRIKMEAKRKCKEAHDNYINSKVSESGATKRFWSYVKTLKKDGSGIAPLKTANGALHSDNKSKANILNNQFSSVFNTDPEVNLPKLGQTNIRQMPYINVTTPGIVKLLKGLKEHKASGPDQVTPRLLKHICTEIAPILQLFFQATLHQGKIPQDWKTANVVPIYKKGDKHKAENYRPVSLTSIVCKMCEHIIASNVMRHLDKHKILTDCQHGFRKKRSCETQLIITTNDLTTVLEEGGQTDVILLDFAKAFDKVPHKRLLHKLHHYGIRGSILEWIRSFLNERSQQVVLEGSSSERAPVKSGVPQGSVLGPLLFLAYINDLPEKLNQGTVVKLFADDCVLYRRIENKKDCDTLQGDLDQLQRWESDWLMRFHPNKCQVVRVTNKKNIIRHEYTIRGEKLEVVENAKYLGVNINNKMSWNNHIDSITKKAHKTLGFLQRNTSRCPEKTKELCYKALVRPQVEYSSVVWDPHTKTYREQLEKVQRRAAPPAQYK